MRILSLLGALSFFVLIGLRATPVAAEEFGGIDFPQGAASFADAVASYDPVFDVPGSPANTDSEAALGVPDDEDVSLGNACNSPTTHSPGVETAPQISTFSRQAV